MKKKMLLIPLALLLAVSLVATGCPPPAEEMPVFPIEVTDQVGRVVKLEEVPERIISLAPSNTEIVFALGLDDRLVGVTDFCNYPEAALDIPTVGGFYPPNIEKVVALEPDLILATDIHQAEVIPAMEGLGLTVLTLDPGTLDEVLESITLVGEITGKSEEASQLVTGMGSRIKAITDRTEALTEAERPGVLYVVWHDPLWVAGSGTFADDLIKKAGGRNIAHDLEEWAVIDLETVIDRDPEVIIAIHRAAPVADEPRLAVTRAVMEDRVYVVEEDPFARPGPRLVDALEELAGLLHPELFASDKETAEKCVFQWELKLGGSGGWVC